MKQARLGDRWGQVVKSEIFKFRWMGWRRFAYDFLVIQFGFVLFGLAIDIMVRANLGLGPWDVLHMALTYHLPITLGEASIGVAFVVVLLDVILREPLGWGTIANMIFIGVFVGHRARPGRVCRDEPGGQGSHAARSTIVMGFA